jgi:hypothetical protein
MVTNHNLQVHYLWLNGHFNAPFIAAFSGILRETHVLFSEEFSKQSRLLCRRRMASQILMSFPRGWQGGPS